MFALLALGSALVYGAADFIGGLTSRELLMILRGLVGLRLVSADVVEVSPPYDHADLTSLAAATVVYELVCLLASGPSEARTTDLD